MTLVLYNTAAREKQVFEPLTPGHVGMYVCGPTVYDLAHIGNARAFIVFDVLYRLLQRHYADVVYVRNITDVDDKINAAAKARGEPIEAITTRTTEAFHADMTALGVLAPTVEPRATAHIPEMIAMIEALLRSGHAYVADGHVLFDVPSMPEYGRLSGRKREDLIAGARIEVAAYKKDPADFVLWKPSTPDLPGWDSPWGRGRPGWHLECSAMSGKYLGETFDIHGGGRDLIFPHHENEVAQSTCAHNGTPFVRTWVHNGFVTVNGEKMAKSQGNVLAVRDLLTQQPGEAIRYAMLTAHYRQPLDWTDAGLTQARAALDRLYTALRRLSDIEAADIEAAADVMAALEDDLNTPEALAALHRLASAANKAQGAEDKARVKGQLVGSGWLLGLLQQDAEKWFKQEVPLKRVVAEAKMDIDWSQRVVREAKMPIDSRSALSEDEIEKFISERDAARRDKNFAEADRIRDELAARGITLEDGPQGTTWRRAG